MENVVNTLITILLMCMLVLQIILLVSLIFSNIIRRKEERRFYAEVTKIIDKSIEEIDNQIVNYSEEAIESEQAEPDKNPDKE